MRKYIKYILVVASAVLTFIATTGAANACTAFFYQPEVPAALRQE